MDNYESELEKHIKAARETFDDPYKTLILQINLELCRNSLDEKEA